MSPQALSFALLAPALCENGHTLPDRSYYDSANLNRNSTDGCFCASFSCSVQSVCSLFEHKCNICIDIFTKYACFSGFLAFGRTSGTPIETYSGMKHASKGNGMMTNKALKIEELIHIPDEEYRKSSIANFKDEAISEYRDSLSADPDGIQAQYDLAFAYFIMDMDTEALEVIDRMMKDDNEEAHSLALRLMQFYTHS